MRKSKITAALLFSLLFAAVISLTAFTVPVWAGATDDDPVDKMALAKEAAESEDANEGQHVHADPVTFEKNFCLSVDQKEYTITEIESVISYYLKPEMSDLEKYYTLAKWANQRVIYDGEFWDGAYEFDYYRNQWDAYGCMVEDEKSVCAGIAIFYSNLCHAADLPCKFVRLNPKTLDHTITYIPDINGHAYYADITENDFLMSKKASYFAEDADLKFSGIVNENADDGTFEYQLARGTFSPSSIKECWQEKVSYKKWFREYALHEGTDKVFATDYDEQGSGLSGRHRASYQDFENYPAQPYYDENGEELKDRVTGIWFLDDFYMEPKKAEASIRNKELDKQFLNISGVKKNYDCADTDELIANVSADISVGYFPSVDENDEVVAEEAALTCGVDKDYTITYGGHDEETGEEVLYIVGTEQGENGYKGTCELRVRMNSAYVETEPARIIGLVFNGQSQKLIEPGEAGNGTMFYAVCKPGESPKYSQKIPAKTNAGEYDVWYKVMGENGHSDMPPQKLERPRPVSKAGSYSVKIAAQDIDEAVKLSKKTFTYNGKVQKPSIKTSLKNGTDYKVSWENSSSKKAGTYEVTIEGKGNYTGTIWEDYTIKKAANTLKISAKTATVKRSAVKKKAQTLNVGKVIKFTKKGQGTKTYAKISGNKKITINKKTGKVTVKKGLKKGTYKVKVKVKAAGNANYKASAWKKVTFKVKVK